MSRAREWGTENICKDQSLTIHCNDSDSIPCEDPYEGEAPEDDLCQLLPLDILAELGQLQERVSAVMENEDKGSDPDEVTGPGEHHQEDGDNVMDHVLEEIFPLDIHKLSDGQGDIEANLCMVMVESLLSVDITYCLPIM